VFYRHLGLVHDDQAPKLIEIISTRMLDRARVLGAAMRVAYMVSAAMPGVLPRAPLRVQRGRLVLRLTGDLKALAGERVNNRLRTLARLIGREPQVIIG
jgi:exopolyphosphatase/guanosine-5'-triphosphate,3'-diphosphate pyrophosphatase